MEELVLSQSAEGGCARDAAALVAMAEPIVKLNTNVAEVVWICATTHILQLLQLTIPLIKFFPILTIINI